MACSLKVLVDIKRELEERLTQKEISSLKTSERKEKHKEILREIYNDACRWIASEAEPEGSLYHVVDHIKDEPMSFEDAQDSEGYGFGAVKPVEIRDAILLWNLAQSQRLIWLIRNFEKLAEEHGFQKLSELFAANIAEDGRIPEGRFQYPASIYELRKALDTVDGAFTYGQYMGFCDEDSVKPYVPRNMMDAAKEHPGDFLILEVYYD